jgi:hypothetical protein
VSAKKENAGAAFVWVLLAFVPMAAYGGWVTCKLWGWFATP